MKLTKKQLEQVENYHRSWVERGGKLTSYRCGHCRKMIKTPQPRKDQVARKGYWDSAKICLKCGHLSFVAVFPNGKTVVKKLPY